jgi:hypothetical protein
MNAQFHIQVHGTTFGPYTAEDLRDQLRDGLIRADTPVSGDSGAHWQPLRDVIGLPRALQPVADPRRAPLAPPAPLRWAMMVWLLVAGLLYAAGTSLLSSAMLGALGTALLFLLGGSLVLVFRSLAK